MARLSEIFNLQMGKTPARANSNYWEDGTNSWVSIADLSSYEKYVGETKEKITDLAVRESGIKAVPPGTVIMSFKLSLGKTAITREAVYTNEAIMAFIPNGRHNICPDYFFYMLSGKDWSKGTNRAVMGATLNKATLGEIDVAVPTMKEQQYIASVLDKLNGLISLRKQQLTKLDELVKARFVEMFEREYPIVSAESVCLTIVDCPHTTPRYDGGELVYPAIRTSEIRNGEIDWSSMKYVSYSEYLERTKRLAPISGDIVYAREGTYGDCVILPKSNYFCLGQRTMLFRPDTSKCIPAYLHQALRSDTVKRQADESNAGSTVPHVNVADAKNFKFPLPPLKKQHQFASFMARIEKSRLTIQRSLDQLEMLKESLMQKYFE